MVTEDMSGMLEAFLHTLGDRKLRKQINELYFHQ